MKEKNKTILSRELLIQDYKVTGAFNPYLIGSKIIDTFVLSKEKKDDSEGGLTIIFEKDKERGILIYGYNDMGEWIAFLQVGSKVIHDHRKYFDAPYMTDQLIQEYHIVP